MEKVKSPDSYRVFILGESAALGDPDPAFGAGRYLQVLLSERFPGQKFEVINLGIAAINSHVILPIARECAAQHGDLWVIYMGNNEMVGPFGAATVFGRPAPPRAFVRLSLAVQKARLGQLLFSVGRKLRGTPASSWAGMHMFDEKRVLPNSKERQQVYENFEANLRDIVNLGLASGARVLLCTVPVNLRDCPPFASLGVTNLPASVRPELEKLLAEASSFTTNTNPVAAANCYERAASLAPQMADLQFQWAQCLLQLTNRSNAPEHFQAACDCDELPFRADSRINEGIRDVAHQTPNPALLLLDSASLFATNSPLGVPGQGFFYEHVHLTFDGNYLLGRAWAEQVANFLPAAMTNRSRLDWATQQLCEQRLGLTDWGRCDVVQEVLRRLEQPPFNAQTNTSMRRIPLETRLKEWRRNMDAVAAAKAKEICLAALKASPSDPFLLEKFAELLMELGDFDQARVQWQQLQELLPCDYLPYARLGWLAARQKQWAEAENFLGEVVARRPFQGEAWFQLGQARDRQSKFEEALKAFERARELQPEGPFIYFHIGNVLVEQHRTDKAIASFRRAIQLKPDFYQAYEALGQQLELQNRIAEVRVEFEHLVQLTPASPQAHLLLAMVMLKQGSNGPAVRELQEVLRLDPANQTASSLLDRVQPRVHYRSSQDRSQ